MKTRSVQQKLDTSFVDLSALVSYLRERKFVGLVHLETQDYQADVILTNDGGLESREIDHREGRVSAGDQVFERVLRRAKEPGGTIFVYETAEEITEPPTPRPLLEIEPRRIPQPSGSLFMGAPQKAEKPPPVPPATSLKERLGLPNLPFTFSNKFEKKARQLSNVTESEWDELLELMALVLHTVESSLAQEKLNFAWVFDKARVEVARDYPFLRPGSESFEYVRGRVSMDETINPTVFASGLFESIKLILEKLEAHPRFLDVHQRITENLRDLLDKHREQFERFAISDKLRRIIGI